MSEEAYCYPGVPVLCGECSWVMSSSGVSDHTVRPFAYRAVCVNKACKRVGIVYSLEALRIPLKRVETP